MKRNFPFKRIISVLSIAFVYIVSCVVINQCGDLLKTQELSEEDLAISSQTTYNSDNLEEIIDTEANWWKAGINDYKIIEEIMVESVETIIQTSATTTTQATTRPEQTTLPTQTTRPETTTTQTTTKPAETTTTETSKEEVTTKPETTPPHDITGDTLSVYNLMNGSNITGDAYDILCQVVYNEVGSSFSKEAIKAQAVAAYTFIKYYNERGTFAQVALKPNPPSAVKKAVSEVAGISCYYNGKRALTTYFASSAGSTVWCKDVFGTNYPYLVSVESKYDYLDPNYGRTLKLSESQVKSYIEGNTNIKLSSNPENWFTFLDASQGGVLSGNVVGKLLIDGNSTCSINGHNYTITGRILREKIFNFKLRSASFDVSYSNGTFTFTTYGYGHGVGMSQNGANLYAINDGWTYDQILKHYYKGITVK